jgi:hypothetical protein
MIVLNLEIQLILNKIINNKWVQLQNINKNSSLKFQNTFKVCQLKNQILNKPVSKKIINNPTLEKSIKIRLILNK